MRPYLKGKHPLPGLGQLICSLHSEVRLPRPMTMPSVTMRDGHYLLQIEHPRCLLAACIVNTTSPAGDREVKISQLPSAPPVAACLPGIKVCNGPEELGT